MRCNEDLRKELRSLCRDHWNKCDVAAENRCGECRAESNHQESSDPEFASLGRVAEINAVPTHDCENKGEPQQSVRWHPRRIRSEGGILPGWCIKKPMGRSMP